MRIFGGIVLALATLLGGFLLEGGNPLSLLGFSAFLIVFFMTAFAVLAVQTWSGLRLAWRMIFVSGQDPAAVTKAIALWRFASTTSFLTGLVALLTGFVLILGNFSEGPHLGQAVAASLLGLIYGLIQGWICLLFAARITLNQN